MLTFVPVAAVAWELEPSVVERIFEDAVDAAQRQCFIATRLEVQIVLQPVVKFTTAVFFARQFFGARLLGLRDSTIPRPFFK